MNASTIYEFAPFRLLPPVRQLLRDGAPIKLGGRAFDALVALVERRDRIVSKNELMDAVWPTVVVEENNLEVQISTLRKLLGHPAILTIPGRGYRFTLPVVEEGASNATVRSERAADARASGRRTNLPTWLPQLIGRDEELASLLDVIERNALVTITGPGGSGKTLLAQTAAARRTGTQSGGIWWVDLAAMTEPSLVAHTVALAMGLRLEGERDIVQAIVSALQAAPSLLVLDNAEHLQQAVAKVVVRLRSAAPQLRVLVTSQEVLRLADEQVFRLEPLSLPEDDDPEHIAASGAVKLFVDRARAADRRFVLNGDNRNSVADICRRLDGIPLALELAAARVPLLGVDGLRQRLENRLQVLTSGDRSALRRHQTLRAALEWSYQLLAPAEQTVLCRLGIFAGGFTLEAAQQVAADTNQIDCWDVLEHLGALVDKSLVIAEGDPLPRYRMLDTTRLFALERLIESGEASACRNRHRDHFLEIAEDALENMRIADPRGLAALDRDRDNLLLALSWHEGDDDGTRGHRLAAAMRYFWTSRGLVERGLQVTLDALARPQAQAPSAPRCLALGAASYLSALRGRLHDAKEFASQSVELARGLGDARQLCLMLAGAGFVHLHLDDLASATRCAEEALKLGRELGDSHEHGNAIALRAALYNHTGEHDRARHLQLEGIAMRRRMNHLWSVAIGLINLAIMETDRGDTRAALPFMLEVLALSGRVDSEYIGLQLIRSAAGWAAHAGMVETAIVLDAACAALHARTGMTYQRDSRELQRFERARVELERDAVERLQREGRSLSYSEVMTRLSAFLRAQTLVAS